ncbi:NAD(P)-binding domain-containing protein [Acaryochloris sp. CCMEE 5410]|uniref:NAD(P)-binding domain-containing protein n=1 Tax=Acaryochloris sp. CCMEE 5410 TaxID=310037 RepID=UPI00024843A8|nr:NAD(P)-binding domain-containing protein [Acaryochloris sp. CCMEE 5410]KAI9131351.1 NAD(P)-binding domain-containing protein [Acaryochloris sp. CCMEE 5410]
MKDVLAYIEMKKKTFEKLPFFNFLQNKEVDPRTRLSFAPCAAPFVMSFGELNKSVLREEPTDDEIQLMINKHTYADDHHWVWFLRDLKKLGFDKSMRFSEVLRFVWGKETVQTRALCRKLIECSAQTTSLEKLIIIEAIEATAQVSSSFIASVGSELQEQTGQSYLYFGDSHLEAEESHSLETDSSELKEALFSEHLPSSYNLSNCYALVDKVFDVFTDFTHELMSYIDKNMFESFSENEHEYLIIGAGPAGLQMGYFLERAGRDYKILEAGNNPGTFFQKYPRHKKLISINKRFTGYTDPEINLRWDWNSLLSDSEDMLFKFYSKDYFPSSTDYVKYLGDFAKYFNLNIEYNCKVSKVSKNKTFTVYDQNGNCYKSKRLIIASGTAIPYVPNIPGIEYAENYTDISIDADDFANQRVLIIGKGNSGFETADNLVSTTSLLHIASPNPISMAWKTKYVGHLRAVNNNLLDTYQLKSQNVLIDADIENIEYVQGEYIVHFDYSHADGEKETLVYDRVIVCTGFKFDDSIFDDSCKPELTINQRFPNQTSEWESTNVPDLYFAGVLMHMRDFKKKQSGFIHGFRYNIRALHNILEKKYYSQSLPHQLISTDAGKFTDLILNRVNSSSGLWQQTGYLCDVIVVSNDGSSANYYQDIPVDYVTEKSLSRNNHYYTITLEFGLDIINASPDPFAVDRIHKDDLARAELSSGIHPIIRRYCQGALIAEHHVIEDIASEWKEEVHIQPLSQFLTEQLAHSQGIGARLLEAGLLTSEQLEVALAEQELQATARLGEVIQKRGWVKERTIQFLLNQVNKTLVDNPELSTCAQLGANLVEAGLATSTQVDQALLEQQTSNKRLGEILVNHGWVTPQTIEYMMKHLAKPTTATQPEVAVLN